MWDYKNVSWHWLVSSYNCDWWSAPAASLACGVRDWWWWRWLNQLSPTRRGGSSCFSSNLTRLLTGGHQALLSSQGFQHSPPSPSWLHQSQPGSEYLVIKDWFSHFSSNILIARDFLLFLYFSEIEWGGERRELTNRVLWNHLAGGRVSSNCFLYKLYFFL